MASDSDSDSGHDFNMDDSDADISFSTEIIDAAASGDLEEVRSLLTTYNTDIDAAHPEDRVTALQVSSYQGHADIVSFLLKIGADVHNKGGTGYAPIHMACENGADEVIEVLLKHGANVLDREIYNKTPLYIASGRVGNETIKMLLDFGADPCDDRYPKYNPLSPACESGHYEVVQTLLDHGARLSGEDVYGRTPLQSAFLGATVCSMAGRWPHVPRDAFLTIKILLEHGADPNVPDAMGHNLLETARMCWLDRSIYEFDPCILTILLDYLTGVGVKCCWKQCKCNTTVFECCYLSLSPERLPHPPRHLPDDLYDQIRDCFEAHSIKTRTIELCSLTRKKAAEPHHACTYWSKSRCDAYRTDCEAEITRMMTETIGNTSATFFNLLQKDVGVLQNQHILRKLTGNDCVQRFPIYGNMIFCSYVKLRGFFILEECTGFFSMLSPPLVPDCIEIVLKYLSNKDKEHLVDVSRDFFHI